MGKSCEFFKGDTFVACPEEDKEFNPDSYVKLSKKIFTPVIQKSIFSTLIESSGLRGVVSTDLQLRHECGTSLNYRKPTPLFGDGVTFCETLEGHEECPPTEEMSVKLGRARQAICMDKCGSWSRQNCGPYIYSRQTALEALKEWFGTFILSSSFIHQVTGYTGNKWITYLDGVKDMKDQFRGFNPIYAPSNHYAAGKDDKLTPIAGKLDAESQITTNGRMSVALIRQISALTVNGQYSRLQPLSNAEAQYVMFLHPSQVVDLKSDPEWTEILALGDIRGSKNRLFTGALGVVDGIIIRSSSEIPNGLTPDGAMIPTVRRAVLLGADAATLVVGGFGMKKRDGTIARVPFELHTRIRDYNDKTYLGMGMIFGLAKNRFNGQDFSAMVISTYADNHRYSTKDAFTIEHETTAQQLNNKVKK